MHTGANVRMREQTATTKTQVEDFAERLRACLELKSVTKAELARRTGISASAIGNYLRAQDTPVPAGVFAIEDALDLAAGHLSSAFGYVPAGEGHRPPGFVEAVLADPHLKDDHKTTLLGVYRGFLAAVEG